ncbi:NUDIX hydrolase [Corynebacterium pseudotuberculosis]|uniref:NUDIX domain-containing protein n=1 Tax=Corynebacterium pseudotuberculosis (strain C231) TaxID=681645 RepID=D9QDF3_CORP2|nr:NUDIX hydrolase [Corynebacterium pseudotuberculosis]ADK29889.1 NUDIX domain-containing protein [Corynebacterium pseudotuberculosis FRC41]ADL11538.1 NUDIX domain-containing protein [Corynebacterium pseudotuberculosis C231]ADL21951.1 NUDIX hydrolase [Corynebacterium pseudotuberculosis 1002]ADO27348.1 NUDIX domain-containing protein [Corynebacterium pseudotuberculosis I19]AEK93409.1 MutT/NUDIX family protein [Corynebacterium pseudotuberculosis PAT10]
MSENEQSRLSSVNSTESTAPRRRRRTRSRRLGSDQTGRSSQSHRTAEGGRASATQQSEKKRADSQRNANAQTSGEERASKSKKSSSQENAHGSSSRGQKTNKAHKSSKSRKNGSRSTTSRSAAKRKENQGTTTPQAHESGDNESRATRRKRRTRTGQRTAQRSTPTSTSTLENKRRRRRPQNAHRSKNSRASLRNQYQTSKINTRDETSAGGLVISGLAEAVDNNNNVDLSRIYVALIGRLDRRGRLLWSMPKGHVEPGEDKGKTAEREVWEETGIHGEVFADLGTIDYWFVSEGVRIHKTVHHHLLRYVDGDLNDEDPEVTEVSWIPADELIEHFAYADERKLARIAHDLIPEYAIKEKAEGRKTPR